jgi:hypothetical protein
MDRSSQGTRDFGGSLCSALTGAATRVIRQIRPRSASTLATATIAVGLGGRPSTQGAHMGSSATLKAMGAAPATRRR